MRYLSILFVLLVFCVGAYGQKFRPAEDFSAVGMNGQNVELSALRGKVVLLTFWSTRCAICHTEIPKLNRIAASKANSNVVFLAATMENEDKVISYTRHNPFSFDILPNSFGLLLKYADRDDQGNVNIGFPAYFLIDREGRIDYRASGWDRTKPLESAIAKLVSK